MYGCVSVCVSLAVCAGKCLSMRGCMCECGCSCMCVCVCGCVCVGVGVGVCAGVSVCVDWG